MYAGSIPTRASIKDSHLGDFFYAFRKIPNIFLIIQPVIFYSFAPIDGRKLRLFRCYFFRTLSRLSRHNGDSPFVYMDSVR